MTDHLLFRATRHAVLALAAMGCIALAAGTTLTAGAAPAAARTTRAHAAHVLNASDTAHLHYVSASGSLLLEEGKAAGTLPGRMRARMNLGTTFTGTFTIYASGGTIVGHGSASPHGEGTYESFSGTIVVTGGTGRYAHARGRSEMSGTFDRDNYALVVKTSGRLTY